MKATFISFILVYFINVINVFYVFLSLPRRNIPTRCTLPRINFNYKINSLRRRLLLAIFELYQVY